LLIPSAKSSDFEMLAAQGDKRPMSSGQERSALAEVVGRWLQPAHAGSSEAVGHVLEECRRYLLLVANRALDADLQPKVGPSDLVQDTLLEAQRDFGQFHGNTAADLRAWLRRILLNNVANVREHYRATRKRDVGRELPIDRVIDGPRQEILVSKEPSPSGHVVANERSVALARAMALLPEQYRDALRLRHQESCSFEEIGRCTGRSADAARKLWARAVEQLKQILKQSDDLP
jgi:RNA polymerase sigma-70 factor (ECF subfamily)